MQFRLATMLGRFFAASLLLALAAGPGAAQSGPDFDAVAWVPAACSAGDAAGDEHPSAVDMVGDATRPAAYVAHDADFLYFRYRVDGDPSGPGGFDSYSWNALVQVPSGDPFQYQYELALFGTSDTLQIWANTSASDIDFSPLFGDAAELLLSTQGYAATSPPLARALVASDGSTFGGTADYFVDFAFPVSALVGAGAIASAADLDHTFFFPVTSTNPNNYNKGHLDCAFTPSTDLALDASVAPAAIPANATTPVAYTLAIENMGGTVARGVVIEQPSLPSWVAAPVVTVSSDDPTVTWTVVGTMPLEVRVPTLPIGKSVTVQIAATATPACGDGDATATATAFATNAVEVADDAVLAVNAVAGGCAACSTDAECDDANPCTSDACVAGACTAVPASACVPCATDVQCDDGDPCTSDACAAGACAHAAIAGCGDTPPVEACHNGLDDDGDGHVDCDDAACAADPGCRSGVAEVCGDCIDNDGDGLVDYEDPDCCVETSALAVRRLRMRAVAKTAAGRRLRLGASDPTAGAAHLDPMTTGTTVQLSDPSGTLFCKTMPASAWRHPHARVFRFRDKTGALAGGLKRGRFKMKKQGGAAFRTVGARLDLRETAGRDVRVTVAAGGRCAQATLQLRARGAARMFP